MRYLYLSLLALCPGMAFSKPCDSGFVYYLKNALEKALLESDKNSFKTKFLQWGAGVSESDNDTDEQRAEKLAKRKAFEAFLNNGIFDIPDETSKDWEDKEVENQNGRLCEYKTMYPDGNTGPITGFATTHPDDSHGDVIVQDVYPNPDYRGA